MKLRNFLFALVLIVSIAAALMAADFWDEKPFTTWNRTEVADMLSNSPWAQVKNFVWTSGGRKAGGTDQREWTYIFTAQFFSAVPIRQGFARMIMIANNFDQMSEEQQKAFAARLALLRMDFKDKVAVTLAYKTNSPDDMRNMKLFFQNASAESLKQKRYLITQHNGRVQLIDYVKPDDAHGQPAQFVFPRMVKDKPIIMPDDKEVTFDLGGVSGADRIFMAFKPKQMVFKGELAY